MKKAPCYWGLVLGVWGFDVLFVVFIVDVHA